MTYWPWWAGGLALAGVMYFYWLATRQMMGVSGRYTALIDRARLGPPPGAGAAAAPVEPPLDAPQTTGDHVVFLACLAAGGLASSLLAGRFRVTPLLAGAGFHRMTHGSPVAGAAVLVVGGALVGFGTRMAGGCTSGHGMCGVSRLQKGSLLATAAFFGAGVASAFALGWL